MPHLTTEELKRLRDDLTYEYREGGEGPIHKDDHRLALQAPAILSELITLREKMEGLRGTLEKDLERYKNELKLAPRDELEMRAEITAARSEIAYVLSLLDQ